MNRLFATACVGLALTAPSFACAEDSDVELAKKLSNPIASLISVPLQFNYDCCFGPSDGGRYVLNVQPVIPVSLNQDWNLIIRTILPLIDQERTAPTVGNETGLGDTTQSFFFSPKASTSGFIWGVGPAFLWPTATNNLGAKQWGAGPTGVILKQTGGWTFVLLANQIWSYAATGGNPPAVNSTFVQPVVSWTSRLATTVSINTESTYNWETKQWSVPINLFVSHLYKFGKQPVSLGAGIRVYAARDSSNGSPSGPDWGARFTATFLYPK
jgi:hypothetical protein